jgi:hypothetical protein
MPKLECQPGPILIMSRQAHYRGAVRVSVVKGPRHFTSGGRDGPHMKRLLELHVLEQCACGRPQDSQPVNRYSLSPISWANLDR